MSRISLMVLVVAAVLAVRDTESVHSFSVGEASVQGSLEVRGGAASCAGEIPNGICYGQSSVCSDYNCVSRSLGFPTFETVWECESSGQIRNRWFAWTCVTVFAYPGQWYDKEFCGTMFESWCFDRDTCSGNCRTVLGIKKCQSITTNLPPIKEGRFDELRGEGGACQIDYIAYNTKSTSATADWLPSFAQSSPMR